MWENVLRYESTEEEVRAVFSIEGLDVISDERDDDELPQQDGCDPILFFSFLFLFFVLIPLCNISVLQKIGKTTFLSSK